MGFYANGALTGTPDNDDVGANAVVLSATDGTTAVTQSFTVTVANVNSMGSVSISGTTAEDHVTATVSDPDGLTGGQSHINGRAQTHQVYPLDLGMIYPGLPPRLMSSRNQM